MASLSGCGQHHACFTCTSGFEDAPELTMDIAVAIGGTYEVILNFLDSRENPGDGTCRRHWEKMTLWNIPS